MKNLRSLLYVVAKHLGDFNAVKKGRVSRRVSRRVAGRCSARLMRKLFK